MDQEPLRLLLRRLHHLTGPPGDGGLSDAALLERFVARRDEAAFEVLVWRHGPMVLGLCRRLLRHEQDAEDAFQATFLTLVRKAGSIGKREAVGAWLYRVAYRIALAARAAAASRAARQQSWAEPPAVAEPDDPSWRELRPVLDEEVSRLPERYRAAFVLCCLEGKTNEEAAQLLGCPKGTVLSRLSRARERLRWRLTRRGLALSAALLAVLAAGEGLAAEVPAGLVEATLRAALAVAAGKSIAVAASGSVAALTEGVLRTMFLNKLKVALAVLVVAGLVVGGVGVVGSRLLTPADAEEGPKPAKAEKPKPGEKSAAGAAAAETDDPVRAAARRGQSQRNLRMIAIALHNYHDAQGRLPAPAIYSKDGKPLLSWRVAILPYVEQDNLFKQFKLDEPWDSAHNKKLLAQMPNVYAAPGPVDKESAATYYQAIVGMGTGGDAKSGATGEGDPAAGGSGAGTPGSGGKAGAGDAAAGAPAAGSAPVATHVGPGWERGRGLRFVDFTDGTSNTLMVVEAATPVPWTKPEDLPYVADQALPKFGGIFGGDFNAVFADGSASFLSKKADEDMLRAAITRNGGEVVEVSKLLAAGGRGAGDKVDAQQLARDNDKLRDAVEKGQTELDQLKSDLGLLKAQLARGTDALDAKTVKLLKQNEELQDKLGQLLKELDALKAEKARLEKELEKSLKDRK